MDLTHPKIEKAFDWLQKTDGAHVLSSDDHCETRDIFQARLDRMKNKMIKKRFEQSFPLVIAITGELGNNAFDHNLGKWRDEPGVYFVYDIEKKLVVIADRGQGVLSSLKRVRNELETERGAVQLAFTESISGRSPEQRGNGLKFVRQVIETNGWTLYFQSGNGRLEIEKTFECSIDLEKNLKGVLAVLYF